ncbi:MAG: hypothetical protein KAJ37_02880, partial [Candidatus Krumholzibacteria bacterium]|nr:hypothetical protein [Candidatus Krumholzibacteria bacterium]
VSRETPVGDLFENGDFGGDADVSVAVLNHSFVTELRCTRCDHRRPFLMLEPSLKAGSGSKCRKCGGEMIADSFDLEERLYASDLPARTRARPLNRIGLRVGDVIRVDRPGGGVRHIEVGLQSGVGAETNGKQERRAS